MTSGGYLYAILIPNSEGKTVFKVGKTINLAQRCKSYRSILPDAEPMYIVSCIDRNRSERMLHNLLRINGAHVQNEIFRIEPAQLHKWMLFASHLGKTAENNESTDKILVKLAK